MYKYTGNPKIVSIDVARHEAKELANKTGAPQLVYSLYESETVYPDLIPGVWYLLKQGNFTFIARYCNSEVKDKIRFDAEEIYRNDGKEPKRKSYGTEHRLTGLATNEQVEAHLISAAILRGFDKNTKMKYDPTEDKLYFDGKVIYDGRSANKWGLSKMQFTLSFIDENGNQIIIKKAENIVITPF